MGVWSGGGMVGWMGGRMGEGVGVWTGYGMVVLMGMSLVWYTVGVAG